MSGEKDLAIKKFLEKPENFSDLFNGSLFRGKQVLKADMLRSLPGESLLSFIDKEGKKVSKRQYRDAIYKAQGRTAYAVFAVEAQDKTHYAMPVREMLYDAMNYSEQVQELTDKHRRNRDYRNSAEFLSGLVKEDRLMPVVTICFHYGTAEWEGPLELFDMLDIPEEYEDMKPFMMNYKVNLVQAPGVNPDYFQTDLKLIFSLLPMASDGKEMKKYIQERPEVFGHIPYETYDCLKELLHIDKWWKTDTNIRKGEVDMCKALEEISEMARQEGITKGKKDGIEQGLRLAKQVLRLAREGCSVEDIAETCGTTPEWVHEITGD